MVFILMKLIKVKKIPSRIVTLRKISLCLDNIKLYIMIGVRHACVDMTLNMIVSMYGMQNLVLLKRTIITKYSNL